MEKQNSEDEEGQLEEQIEKLQEKVESAQSEQKNLFLVIFQVRPWQCTSILPFLLVNYYFFIEASELQLIKKKKKDKAAKIHPW